MIEVKAKVQEPGWKKRKATLTTSLPAYKFEPLSTTIQTMKETLSWMLCRTHRVGKATLMKSKTSVNFGDFPLICGGKQKNKHHLRLCWGCKLHHYFKDSQPQKVVN